MKTSELTGHALDWAVAECEGKAGVLHDDGITRCIVIAAPSGVYKGIWRPTINWAQAGPIIEREKIEWQWLPAPDKAHQYGARKPSLGGLNRTFCMDGPTVLVAAMRCYVASKLGDEIEIPEELI